MAQGQESGVGEAPDTLPPDFFDKKNAAPDTLPADFFEKKNAAPKPPEAMPGAYQTRRGGPVLNASQIKTPSKFESDTMRGMGFSPEKVAAAGPTEEQWRNLGTQALKGLKNFGVSVAKDPFKIADIPEGMASGLENAKSPGEMLGAASQITGGMEAPSALSDTKAAMSAAREAIPTLQGTKEAIGRATRIEPTVENTTPATGTIGRPTTSASLRPWVKAITPKILGTDVRDAANAVLPRHPTEIGPFRRLATGPRTAAEAGDLAPEGTGAPLPAASDFYEQKGAAIMARAKEQAALDRQAARTAAEAGDLAPEGTGAPLPAASDFYEQKGAAIMARAKEQAALDRQAARTAAEAGDLAPEGTGAPLPAASDFYEQKGAAIMARAKEQAALDRQAARTAAEAKKTEIVPPSRGVSVGEPSSTGSEGTAARWTNETVRELAAKGNRTAIEQSIRRGLPLPANSRYVMGDPDYPRAVLNPRETTIFLPDGTAIGDKFNARAENPSSRARIEQVPGKTPETSQPQLRFGGGMPPVRSPEPPASPIPAEQISPPDIPAGAMAATREAMTPRELKLSRLEERPTQEAGKRVRVREPKEEIAPEIAKDTETLEQAKSEIAAMGEMWSNAFERPGRKFSQPDLTTGSDLDTLSELTHATKSARPAIEAQFPWLKNLPKMTAGKLKSAIESGKGVEYNRLVNEAGKHIQATKAASAPVIEEFRRQLETAAEAVKDSDPDLAATFRGILDGKYSSYSDLAGYVKEKLHEAETADQFNQALSRGFEETPESSTPSREATEIPKKLSDAAIKMAKKP